MRSYGVAPNALLAAGPAVPSKCRSGTEDRAISDAMKGRGLRFP
jgi:hypothetical protein